MRIRRSRGFPYITAIGLTILLIFILLYLQSFDNDLPLVIRAESNVIEHFRNCMKLGYENSFTDYKYSKHLDNCLKILPTEQFDIFNAGRFDEQKMFLPMKPEYDQKQCIWLTVGIGGSDVVEREFKYNYPGCKLFGVEASPDQYAGFEKYGQVIPYGVG